MFSIYNREIQMKKTYQKYIENEIQKRENIYISLADGSLNPDCVGWSRYPIQVSNLRGAGQGKNAGITGAW